ncbi:LacI family transcriptional regulator [Marinitenerispora sediminis]|uniref:LacI family transcriptional regulator n=2 Tax=Marinitenerispora sediminis TaxID=1931232 RepID=A0A368SYD2_9ACTN|nr:LacI family transcriptional regulator [Marinitenerispora sediminis]RCV47857.1 LacI family transcriptional regulator [Marinitenerispora sediminis]RCV49073.1 LacI family transcriptional regulator [Marinitenerispora sediminis]
MADVARLAGVSHQTVSRVVNGHPNVREETRRRVRDAIDALAYRRNPAARALVTRRTAMVGVVGPNTTLYGPSSTLGAIERAAGDVGYAVTVAALRDTGPSSLDEAVQRLVGQMVDGIIVIASLGWMTAALSHRPPAVPVVVVDGGAALSAPVVAVDQFAGARAATRHLLDLGHRTVGHIAGPGDWLDAAARLEGWRTELAACGAPVPRPWSGDWSPRSGYDAGREIARRGGVTAVFAGNDHMALGALRAFQEAGLRVPEDIALVGFDDVPEAAFYAPPLTTVRQDFSSVGRRCIELLLARLEDGHEAAEHVLVPPELVVRSSTCAPRSAAGG